MRETTQADLAVPDDLIQPFRIDRHALRGRLVRLGPAADSILSRHAYPEAVATLLGETLVLAAVLAGALKYDGVFTLQVRGDGPVNLMVADVTSAGALRGYARFDAARLGAAAGGTGNPVPRLLGAGHLAFTVDQGPDTERYQGMVDLVGATMAECAHHYFRQSEQLEAAIHIAAGRGTDSDGRTVWRAGGLMVQRVPWEGGASDDDASIFDAEDAEDGWRRALVSMASARPEELLDPDLAPRRLLYRLFHEDGVRVYRTRSLADRCRCSAGRVEAMLRSLPRAEVAALKTDGAVVVVCQFCNASYRYDDAALSALYEDGD